MTSTEESGPLAQQIAQDLAVLEGATLAVPAAWPAFERLRDELERLRGIERHVQDMETALDGAFSSLLTSCCDYDGACEIECVSDDGKPQGNCVRQKSLAAIDAVFAALPAREKGTECPAGHGRQCCGYPDECREAMEEGR